MKGNFHIYVTRILGKIVFESISFTNSSSFRIKIVLPMWNICELWMHKAANKYGSMKGKNVYFKGNPYLDMKVGKLS